MGLYYIFFTYWKNVEVLLYTFVLLIHAAQTLVFNQLCKYQQEMILNSWVSFCLDVFTNVCFFLDFIFFQFLHSGYTPPRNNLLAHPFSKPIKRVYGF